MFVVSLSYTKNLDEVDQHIEAHVEYLKKYYAEGVFLMSGRKVPRTGGLIIANCENREKLDAILERDPFFQADLAEYSVTEFVPSMASSRLDFLLK